MANRSGVRRRTLGLSLLPVALLMGLLAGCQDGNGEGGSRDPVTARIGTGQGPIALTATDDGVWVELHRENRVARIDPETNEQATPLLDVSVHCDIEAAPDSVWATIFDGNTVTRFDSTTGEVLQQLAIEGPCALGVEGRSAWVTSPSTGTLYRLVEGRDEPAERYQVARGAFGVVPAPDCFWITSEDKGGSLQRLDRTTHEVTTVGSFPLVDSGVLAFGYLWISARDGGSVWKLDPSTGRVVDQTMLTSPAGMVAEGDRLWITSQEGSLTSIDPESLEVTSETDLGHPLLGPPIFAFDSLWTAALDENLVLRVDVARVRQQASR